MGIRRHPAQEFLRDVPEHSHAWNGYSWGLENGVTMIPGVKTEERLEECKQLFQKFMDAGALQQWMKEDFFHPVTDAAKRVTTCHSDFKVDNIMLTTEGLKAIDWDFTCVSAAVFDFAFMWNTWVVPSRIAYADRYRFVESYLTASGFLAGEGEVRAFLLDCEVALLGGFVGPLWNTVFNPSHRLPVMMMDFNIPGAEVIQLWKAFVCDVRAQPPLQHDVVEKGVLLAALERAPEPLKQWIRMRADEDKHFKKEYN